MEMPVCASALMNDRSSCPVSLRRGGRLGVSLAELLVVVSVLAVIAAIAVPLMLNLVPSAGEQAATRNLNYLNGAVLSYNQAVEELNTNATEPTILALLQTRDARSHGSPYLPSNLKTNTSSDSSVYRAKWNGRMFEMLPPGSAGTGLPLLTLM